MTRPAEYLLYAVVMVVFAAIGFLVGTALITWIWP